MALISKRAFDLIVQEEVSSKALYEKKYRRPEWPGGASGVTIGIGYDVGAGVSSSAQLQRDWTGHIPQSMIDALVRCIGVTGARAKAMLPSVRPLVDVPWDAAMAVFEQSTLPKYYELARRALPNFDKLSLDCKGVLVSLVYNRGASFNNGGDRYSEMRAIRAHMQSGAFDKIPGELRAMKRLWPGVGGLIRRRDREAALFAEGLKNPVTKPENATTAVIVAAGGTVAEAERQKEGSSSSSIAAIVIITVVVAIAAFVVLRWLKKRKADELAPAPDQPKTPAADPDENAA